MPALFIQHTVQDFDKWKVAFDADEENRKNLGSQGGFLWRGTDDQNVVSVLLNWDSVDNIKKFMESPELKEKMEEAGVTGEPVVYFLEEVSKQAA